MQDLDREVLRIMVDGAERICQHAEDQWLGGKYGPDEERRRESLKRWATIRRRIRPLANEIKEKLA
jgi:hypothetical protein